MKFNAKLDYYENRMAWEEHYPNSPRTAYSSLNEREKVWLRGLNGILRQLEDKYYPIMAAKHQELQARVADPSDWLLDFNLGYLITFYLREDDPEYDEDDDSILMEIKQRFIQLESPDRDPEQVWGFGDKKVHHADQDIFLSDQPHCYLYHELYDHSSLDWRDLLRIGGMWLDIKIDEQTWLPDLGFVQFEQIP